MVKNKSEDYTLQEKVDSGYFLDYIKLLAPSFKKMTPEEQLKIIKELKEIFDNWDNIKGISS